MQDIRGVSPFQTAQQLVQKVLMMLFRQRLLRFDDLIQVGFHQAFNEVSKRDANGLRVG